MPLLSPEFALFFLLLLPLHWALARWPRGQNLLLLAVSLGLLASLSRYFLAVVLGYSFLIYGLDRLLDARRPLWRDLGLSLGIAASLLLLLIFKYYDYYRAALALFGLGTADLVLPLGLSYYIFQGISYLLTRYRRSAPALRLEEVLLVFSCFLTITAGPIWRASSWRGPDGDQPGFLDQLREPKEVEEPAAALLHIVAGVLQKWCLAGLLEEALVRPVFDNPLGASGPAVLAAIYGYSLQLYFDFAGYSALVLGLGRLLGYRLPLNFALPLNAVNLRDFWNRWHISLSSWIRDYIYIPLGGSRRGWARTQLNLLLAFVLSGLWHGTGWNFFYWGLLHGLGLVALNLWQRWRPPPDDWGREEIFFDRLPARFLTFNFVALAFVIFATATPTEALLVLRGLGGAWGTAPARDYLVLGLLLLGWLLLPLGLALQNASVRLLEALPPLWWWLPLTLAFTVIILLAPAGLPGFIYANF